MDNNNIVPQMDTPGTPTSHPATPTVMNPDENHIRFLENMIMAQSQQVQQLLAERTRVDPVRDREGRPRVQLPSFHGQTRENIASWILQMEMGFQADSIYSDERRIAAAATCLRDAAFEWFRSYLNDNRIATWSEFTQEIRRAFLPPNDQHIFRRELKQCRQKGTVQEYVFQFRTIMGQISDMAELDKIDHFINGLRPMTASEVKYRCPSSLKEAIENRGNVARGSYSSGRSLPRRGPVRRSFSHDGPANRGTTPSIMPMELDNLTAGKRPERSQARRERLCFQCGKPGHFARECKMGKGRSGNVLEQ